MTLTIMTDHDRDTNTTTLYACRAGGESVAYTDDGARSWRYIGGGEISDIALRTEISLALAAHSLPLLLVATEGNPPTVSFITRIEFLALNDDVCDLHSLVLSLAAGEQVHIGGGAAPMTTVKRVR